MASQKVRAVREGFYPQQRRYPGEEFEMNVLAMKIDKATGKAVLPSWVEAADKPEPKAEAKEDGKKDGKKDEGSSKKVI